MNEQLKKIVKESHLDMLNSKETTLALIRQTFNPDEVIFTFMTMAKQLKDNASAIENKKLPEGVSEKEAQRNQDTIASVLAKFHCAMPPSTQKMVLEVCSETMRLHLNFEHVEVADGEAH